MICLMRPPHYGLHPPYAAVCYFRRQAGRPDKGNCLESGEIRGNMLTRPVSSIGCTLIVISCNLWEFRAIGFDRIPHNPI